MDGPNDPVEFVLTEARPKFLGRHRDDLYWLSDAKSRLVLVFADRQAVEELFRQIGQVMDWPFEVPDQPDD